MAWNALWSNSSSTRGVLMFDLFSFSLCNNVLSGCRQCPERAGRIWPSAVHSSQGTNFYFLYSKSYVNLISECVTGSSPDWSDLQIGEARWVRRGTKRTWKVLLIVIVNLYFELTMLDALITGWLQKLLQANRSITNYKLRHEQPRGQGGMKRFILMHMTARRRIVRRKMNLEGSPRAKLTPAGMTILLMLMLIYPMALDYRAILLPL